jgi:hypothetical protein
MSDHGRMPIDLDKATSFLAAHGRTLDRRRLQLLLGDGDPDGVLAALDGYRNPDGGYGWGLEPDLRDAASQPTAAMHAFEVLAEVAPATTPRAVQLCDWLQYHSLADGGLPFTLPIDDPAGCAPWWVEADTTTSSLQMTAQVAANAHLVAGHDPAVAGHPWLATATRWCLDAIGAVDAAPPAYELKFALGFLDAATGTVPEAAELLEHLGRYLPAGGSMAVEGGVEGEAVGPLDFAPRPGRPARRLFAADAVAADLDRLAGGQQPDGGWTVGFDSFSPAASLEWRGYATVQALTVLRSNSLTRQERP